LLDGCMYLSYQILSLGYLFSGEGIWRDLLSQAYCNSNIEIEKVAPHMLSTYISPCATSLRPLPFGLKSCDLRNCDTNVRQH